MKKKPIIRSKRSKAKSIWGIRHWIGYGVLSIAVIHFLYVASKKTIENFQLADRGVLTKAFVTKKQKVGGKGTIEFTLRYKVNGKEYLNVFANEPWSVGDSVHVVILNEDPMVMRSFRFISDNYSTSLKLK